MERRVLPLWKMKADPGFCRISAGGSMSSRAVHHAASVREWNAVVPLAAWKGQNMQGGGARLPTRSSNK